MTIVCSTGQQHKRPRWTATLCRALLGTCYLLLSQQFQTLLAVVELLHQIIAASVLHEVWSTSCTPFSLALR